MKIEKLRNNHKKEIIIGTILLVVIGGALTFKLTHSKYRVTQSIDLAEGVIEFTSPDFQIVAIKISDDGENYSDTNDIPPYGYALNMEKSICKIADTVDSNVKIKYHDGVIGIDNITKKGTKCYLYFDRAAAASVILANVTPKTNTPNFGMTVTNDGGVYQTDDGTNMYDGITYYWRGAVTNNYVKFAGFCWRIIRINGDKTIRMIYDGSTCHVNGTNTTDSLIQPTSGIVYNSSSSQSNYVGWTYSGTDRRPSTTNNDGSLGVSSNAKTQTENWYKTNILDNGFDEKVADGKFCNDREIGSGSYSATGSVFYYAGYKRLVDSRTPTFNCSNAGDVYQLKVGAITVDEITFAGGVYNTANTSYYLYNGQYYWTMSPYNWDSDKYARVFIMNSNGSFYHSHMSWPTPGLRPVINLKVYTMFSSGDGTQNNPYVVAN